MPTEFKRFLTTPSSIWVALIVATALKLTLAWFTIGTSDVITWKAFSDNAALCGQCAYKLSGPFGDPFNHPPFIIHFLKLISRTGAWFPFVLRLPGILADVGSVLLVVRLLPKASTGSLILLALNPVSILISGFHGNTDSVMVLFLVLTVYLLTVRREERYAAISFAFSMCIKVVPLIVSPAVFFYLRGRKARVRFILIGTLALFLLSLPYILIDPIGILKATIGYAGVVYGTWGTSSLLVALSLSKAQHQTASLVLRVLIVVITLAIAYYMNRRQIDLFTQFGIILFLFLFLTPSLGVQYLVWPVPFVLILGARWSLAYYLSAGLHLFLTYDYWSHGNWYLADSHVEPQWSAASYMAGFFCWAICALICLRYKHFLKLTNRADREN